MQNLDELWKWHTPPMFEKKETLTNAWLENAGLQI